MFIPRRVRCRLLSPSGWVALGFLLLLGCQALQPWERQLRPINMLQLTLPALRPKLEDVRDFSKDYSIPYKTLSQLELFRHWHDVNFRGSDLSDFLSAADTESAVRRIMGDISHNGGVRVRFLPGATYGNLVRVLDIMRYADQKKYWLAIRHQPITLYAITINQQHLKNHGVPFYLGCCTCGHYQTKSELEATWHLQFQNLWWKPWQPTTLLVALISMLSAWSLVRSK